MTTADRLFTRPSTLSDAEREQARAAVLADPAILEGPIQAALACATDGAETADRMLAVLREARR